PCRVKCSRIAFPHQFGSRLQLLRVTPVEPFAGVRQDELREANLTEMPPGLGELPTWIEKDHLALAQEQAPDEEVHHPAVLEKSSRAANGKLPDRLRLKEEDVGAHSLYHPVFDEIGWRLAVQDERVIDVRE